jgi:hypothetical protein
VLLRLELRRWRSFAGNKGSLYDRPPPAGAGAGVLLVLLVLVVLLLYRL